MLKHGAFLLALVAATPAIPQESDGRWVRRAIRSSCDFWNNCEYRRVWIPYERQRRERYEDGHCKELVKSVGAQAQSEDAAWDRAVLAWQGSVRFTYGEIYMNFGIAKDTKRLCGPSSVSDTVTSKTQEKLFGVEYFRCEVSAVPCRPKRKED